MKHIPASALLASLLMAVCCSASARTGGAPAFADAPGYQRVDAERLAGPAYYARQRFPRAGQSAFHPDADLPAPVRALLLVQAQEGSLPHARYRVSYQVTSPPFHPEEARSYVEVVRINLGPAVRADLASSVPREHLGSARRFGVGPHVSWRFEMAPERGMAAGIDQASRKVLTDRDLVQLDCLGVACGALPSPQGPKGRWTQERPAAARAPYRSADTHGPVPARVVEEMLALMGEDAARPAPLDLRRERVVFVVSTNAGAQDQATEGMARNAVAFDDQAGTQWVRWSQAARGRPQLSALHERRR